MRRQFRTLLVLLLAILLALSPAVALAEESPILIGPITIQARFSDMAGHWAEPWVDQWSSQGLITGYPDGTFGPERTVTQAEFAALLNRALGFALPPGELEILFPGEFLHWYDEIIATAVHAGYIPPPANGDPATNPDDPLTRGEIAVMLAAALRLRVKDTEGALAGFGDAAAADPAHRGSLAALVEAGYMNGFPDATIQPNRETTRAQAVTLLTRALGQMYRHAGDYGPEPPADTEYVPGSASIAADGVKLHNMFIAGDLQIVPAAAGAVIHLSNIAVLGTLRLLTGVTLVMDDCRIAHLDLVAPDPAGADVTVTGDSFVGEMFAGSAARLSETDLAQGGLGFTVIRIDGPAGATVELNGELNHVLVASPGADLALQDGAIDLLAVAAAAQGAKVDLGAGTVVARLLIEARARIAGAGAVSTAAIMAGNVELTMIPGQLVLAPNIAATVGGQTRTGELIAVREYVFAAEDAAGWRGDFCDYPVNVERADWEMFAGLAPLPAELGEGFGYVLQGHNRSDDMFMYMYRQFGAAEGLQPETAYAVWVEFDVGTNAPAGAFGIGGAPGESVFVKIGAAAAEPLPVADPSGDWRLSVDKGYQSEGGSAAVVVGNVAKASSEWSDAYELKTLHNYTQPLLVTTGADATLWVFVGTDSGFEGLTRLYYVRVNVRFSVTR